MSLCENVASLCSGHYSLIVLKMLFKSQLAKKKRSLFLHGVCRSAAVTDCERSPALVLYSFVHYCVDLAKLQGIWCHSFICCKALHALGGVCRDIN